MRYFAFASALAIRDLSLEALFLWITFFFTALSRAEATLEIAFCASSFLPSATNLRKVLSWSLYLSLTRVLMTFLRRDTRMALIEDFRLGIF